MKEIFNLTHYDLDGVASAIAVRHFMQGTGLEYRQQWCGYASMEKKLRKHVAKVSEPILLIVTDLALEPSLIRDMLEDDYVEKFIFIDHHERLDDEMDELLGLADEFHDKFRMIIDYNHSAALLTYDNFVRQMPGEADERIYALAKLADTYDRWQTKSKVWDLAHRLNDAFWELHFDRFFDKFDLGYTNPADIDKIIVGIRAQRKEYMKLTKSRYSIETIINNKKTLIVLNPEAKFGNDFALEFPEYDLFIIFRDMKKDENIFSVRTKINSTMEAYNLNDIFEKLKTEDDRIQGGGHQHSGGVSVRLSDTEQAVELLTEALERELK